MYGCVDVLCWIVHPTDRLGGWLAGPLGEEFSPSSNTHTHNHSHTPTYHSMVALRDTAWTLSGSFWALCVLHSIYINVFHIFLNFSSHYFMVAFGKVGWRNEAQQLLLCVRNHNHARLVG